MITPPGVATSRILLDAYTGGSVVFTPTVPLFRLNDDGSESVLYAASQIGAEVGPGRYVDLVATDAANVTPAPFQWRVQYGIEGLNEQPESVLINTPAGITQSLADLTPLDLAPSIVEVVTDADRRAAEAAAELAYEAQVGAEAARDSIIGGGAVTGREYSFTSAAQWSIAHALQRRPSVTLYDANGTVMDSDVDATTTSVVVTFPNPTTGTVVLT